MAKKLLKKLAAVGAAMVIGDEVIDRLEDVLSSDSDNLTDELSDVGGEVDDELLDVTDEELDDIDEKIDGIDSDASDTTGSEPVFKGRKICATRHGCKGATNCDYSMADY